MLDRLIKTVPISTIENLIRDAFKKKIAEKETLVHMGGRGVKKIPFFSS